MKKYILFALLLSLPAFIALSKDAADTLQTLLFGPQSKPVASETAPVIAVTVTAYSPQEGECDSDPYTTAFQKPVREGTIAISRDLEKEFGWKLGDKVYLNGLGVFEVLDRMHPKWKKRVDIFFFDTEQATSFGVKRASVLKVERQQGKKV